MFSMMRTLLHTSYPIERPSSRLGRKVGIYHSPWIRIGLKPRSFLSDARLYLYLMVMHVEHNLYFVWICLNSLAIDYETQEFSGRYSEGTLGWIQFHVVVSQDLERLGEMSDVELDCSGFYKHFILCTPP